jgi:ribonuclease-3
MKLHALEQLEERIGYHFQDTYLLSCALTHSSWANEQKIHRYKDYERLEFLGDAVLEMISSAFLFHEYPDMREGELSKRRAALVCEPSLAECARRLGIEQHIRLGRGAEADGGREKDSIVSDVMEALIGAMYLDSGSVQVVREFVMTHILADAGERHLFYDAKSILQEIVQKEQKSVRYEVLEETGPGHDRTYTVAVRIDGQTAGTGRGKSKKNAEQHAAFEAVKAIRDRQA